MARRDKDMIKAERVPVPFYPRVIWAEGEDSLIIYSIHRAPERRVWNIDVDKMGFDKALEVVKELHNE